MKKTILITFLLVLTLIRCSSDNSLEEKNKSRVDNIELEKKRKANLKDSLWKASPSYQADLKKISKLKAKYNKLIDNCYGWTGVGRRNVQEYTFDMNKYQGAMKKHKLKQIADSYADYDGYDSGFYVKIEMGQATSDNNGWKQHFNIIVQPK